MVSELFTVDRIASIGPNEFRRDIQRLMTLLGFDVIDADGSGDKGADLVCVRGGEVWVIQSKFKKNVTSMCPNDALDQVLSARNHYNANYAIIATSGRISPNLIDQTRTLAKDGLGLDIWSLTDMAKYWNDAPAPTEWTLRPYQTDAVNSLQRSLKGTKRGLLFLATGLGKTVVSGEIVRRHFLQNSNAKVLVLAHTVELISQLLGSLVSMLPKHVSAQLISGNDKPSALKGLTVATNLSIVSYLEQGYCPDFVVIDEAHHVGMDNTYAQILALIPNWVPLLGVTATPWRSDQYDIKHTFGPPSFECGIEEGMRNGYLAQVDYRLFCDNIDWDAIPSLSQHSYTIKNLNRKLFIPQRDERIVDRLLEAWMQISIPRGIVFCQSIQHCEYFLELVKQYEFWGSAEILHSNLLRSERLRILTDFRTGRCNLILAIDILNEGVDVPDVNLICFARVTHSRKIFIQQLGRGLRVSKTKERVVVLDFVADIRRMFELFALRSEATDEQEHLPYGNKIEFNNTQAERLVNEWIKDAADLSTAHDEYQLNFPQISWS